MDKGIIFDVDGTLLDTMWMWRELDFRFLESVGVEPDGEYPDIVNKMTLEEGVAYTKQAFHLVMSEEEIMSRIMEMAKAFYYSEAKLKPFAKEFLEAMRKEGIPMVVATTSKSDFIIHALRHNGVIHYFKAIYSGSDLGINKTVPDLYLMAADALGTTAENTWVIEDAYHAVRTAKAAGFPVAAVYDKSNAPQLKETIELADIYLADLRNIDEFLAKIN